MITLDTEDSIERFVASARRPGPHVWAARRALRPFLSDFSLNGLFGTYPLHLMDTDRWRSLLGRWAGGRLLDVGAASGEVTETLAPLYDEVVATDTARPMVRRLRADDVEAHRIDIAAGLPPGWAAGFDTVALLNVLDRAGDAPRLLRAAVHACRPGGTVLIALTLPYDPWHYRGSFPVRPRYRLPLEGGSFDDDVEQLVHGVVPAAGLAAIRWIRTPYVSAGRRADDLHRLDCAVVVCRRSA